MTQASSFFASRAAESEQDVERNIASLLEVPREMLRVQNKASALEQYWRAGFVGPSRPYRDTTPFASAWNTS